MFVFFFLWPDETETMDTSQGPEMGGVTDSDEITAGSLVQFLGKRLFYGIVRWTGYLPDQLEKIAGLELVCSRLSKIPVVLKLNKNCKPISPFVN